MTVEEKRKAIEDLHKKYPEFCYDENGQVCPLYNYPGARWCFEEDAPEEDILKSYAYLAAAGFFPEETKESERERVLRLAKSYVCSDRDKQYGPPEDSFKAIAALWSAYLERSVTAADVACLMVLFKMARIKTGKPKEDNWVDAAGYCACGAECQLGGEDS